VILEQLELVDFRNFVSKTFDLNDDVNVVWGKNASGKTNMLEAIYLLGTGNSFRARIIDEMVRFDQELGRVRGNSSFFAGGLERSSRFGSDGDQRDGGGGEDVETEIFS